MLLVRPRLGWAVDVLRVACDRGRCTWRREWRCLLLELALDLCRVETRERPIESSHGTRSLGCSLMLDFESSLASCRLVSPCSFESGVATTTDRERRSGATDIRASLQAVRAYNQT